jgi:Domain of unknown function (DUF4190)
MSDQQPGYPPPPDEGEGSTPPPPPTGGGYTPPPPPPGGGYVPPPPPPGGGYQPFPGGPYGGAPQSNQKALWALIIGIVSIPLACYACLGWVGIVAIVLGNNAKKEIAASGGMQSGAGQAQAGLICGIVGAVLGTIVLAVNIALLASGEGSFDYNLGTG